jgi:hypothetical protein
MNKRLLGVAAISALMTMGIAHAQTTETTTTRTGVAPLGDSYSTTKTQTNSYGGASSESKETYRSGIDGTVSTKKQTVVNPDGSSETMMRKESTTGLPSTTTTTTETIR